MSEADGWEPRSSARARELAQWGDLKNRISPLLSNPDTWSVTRAQRVASEASRVNRGKRYEPPAEEQSDESPLRVLGRMLEVGADTFRDIVPQEVRDVGGAVLNNLFSGERALNTWDRVTRAPGEAVGGAIARGLGLDTARAEETRAQQRPLGTMLGETVEQVPGVGGLLRTGLDVAAAPATILTAGAGGAVGGALRGGGRGGRILANLIEPVAPRGVGFGGRLAAETAAGVGATEGAQYAADQVENPYAKVGLGLLGGVAGGMAGAGLAAQGRAIARGGVNAAARPSVAAFADDMGSLRLRPDEEQGRTVRLYRGDSKPIGTFSMDKTSEGGLFGKGIYLTDKRSVARSYTMKSSEDKIGYAFGARSKAQALQGAIQNKAWEFRMQGLDNAAADAVAEQFFRDAEPLDFVNRGDGYWDIRTKPERENITTVKMPEALLGRMIDAEAPITEQQVEVIRNAVKQRLGYGITRELAKNDPAMEASLRALDQELEYLDAVLDPFEDQDSFYGTRFAGKRDIKSVTSGDQSFTWEGNIGERPKLAEVWEYLMRGIDTPAEREKLQTALRRGFGDLGHTGIRYDGGTRIPGSLGKHDAYVVWDEQGLNKLIKGQPLGKSRETYEAEQAAQAASDRVAEMERVRKPKTVSGGAGAGGVAPPPALAQTFGIEEPAQGLTRAQEFRNTIKEALGQPFGLVVDDPIATPATQARQRWADQITSAATLEGDQARRIIEAAGFQFDDKWGIPALNGKGSIPGNPTLQDVAARLPEYAPYLDPVQFQAIERIAKLMDPYGEVIRQTVGDLSPRGDVQPGGYYLHRGFEPEPEVRISIGGKIGGKAGFEKEAAYGSMAEAVAAGKTPLAPWDSIREYVADVGTRASDRYYSDYLKSTTDALGNKLGMTSADRVPVGLRKRMEDLRSKISARTQILRGQEARGKAAEAELGRAERGAQEAGARVVQAYGKRAALPDVTAEDISAARQSVTDAISEARSLAAEIADHAAKLKGTQNGLNAREREIVAEAGRLEQTLADADQLGLAADRLLSETRVTDLIRTPDTTVARYLEAGFPQEEQIRGRIDKLSKLVTRGADGEPNEGASNVARLQEIGELQALDDIRYALGETGQWDDAALTKLEAVLDDVSRSLEVRDDAAMRARNRNSGGQYGGSEGMSGDLDSLRARAALLFRVWDSGSLEVPVPQLSGEAVDNATRTAVARAEANLKKAGGRALEREQRLLLRQADKIETSLRNLTDGAERMAERVDLATERGAILGDMDQAARQQLVESRRHERAILAGDRRIGAMDREIRLLEQAERRAQRNVSAADVRAQRASARAGQTGADLAQLKADRDALAGDWEHAKALARQTPQGRAAIGLAELQGTDFPTQMANAANRILQSEMSTSGRLSQTIRSMAALNNLLRGMRATADWSFAGIQGAIGLANDPRAYWQAMKTAYQVLGDPNMRAAALGQWDEQNLAQGFLGMRGWTAAGIHQGASQTEYTLRGGPLKALTQMQGIGAPARGVKAVVEGANEAFGTFGDLLRMYHADMLLKRALAKGQIDQAAVLRAQQGMIDPRIRAIANHANLVTGWSPNKFGGEMGDVIQFAPRFFQSQLELSANALMKGGIEGKLARREMLQYLGLAAGTTVLANLALGNGFGEWAKPFKDDSFEKNPNFMRIRAGGRDYSLFGPWDSLLTAMMAAGNGDLTYLARTKASPVVQMTWDLLTGEDFMGNRVEPGANWDFAEWMAKQVTPFSLQDIPATAQQALEGDVFGAGLGLLTETAGVKSSPMTPNEELDAIAQRTAGKPYWDLEPYQREAIKEANPDVWQRSVERGSDARQRAEVVRSEYHAKQLRADNDLLSGTVTRQQWRDQRSTRRIEQRARLEEIYGDSTKRSSEPRNVYERYLALIDASVNPDTGQPDWEAVDAGLARMPAADQAEIEKSVGVGQTPLSREYAKLSKAYYALPRYEGFTADQAREIDAAWTEVKNASETQLGRLRKVRELQEAGVEEAVLRGVRARAMGKSLKEAPDRERFKKENPRYKVLSGSGKLTEADRAILTEVLRSAA